MKLVHINDVVYAYASEASTANGGAERYAWLLTRALASAGWSIAIGVRDAIRPRARVAIDGVEFVGLEPGHPVRSWYRFLKSEAPEWFFWQCADYWWGPVAEMAKLTGVKTVFSAMHDRDVEPRTALLRRRSLWPSYAWGLSRTDRILVQHEGQMSKLSPALRSKASILPGIVNRGNEVIPHSQRADGYVAWVGVLRLHKRPDLLIEIARRMPKTRFVVCGGPTTLGTPAGYTEQIVASLRTLPNVEYRGQVHPTRTLEVIAGAALLLSTSDDEGLPSVFLEAWSAGTPVVSLKVDPDQAIQRWKLGAVSGTPDRAVSDIESLLQSPAMRDEIAARAIGHVTARHSPAAAVRAFEDSLSS